MRKIISLSAVALLFAGCVSNDVDDYRSDNPTDDAAKVNLFDFSTVSEVKLTVDYSASKPTAPIFFKVYSEDPFDGDELNENIKPVYAGFTDADGLFSQVSFTSNTAIVAAAFALAVLNMFVKPVLKFISLPVTFLTFGLFSLIINGAVILWAFSLADGAGITGMGPAILTSFVVSIVTSVICGKDDD